MIIRELPCEQWRTFEVDSYITVIIQPEQSFKYLTIRCQCHQVPDSHIQEISKEFDITEHFKLNPYTSSCVHLVEKNEAGKNFVDALTR